MVNHLRRERSERSSDETGVAVLYLKYNEPEQTLDHLLGSLLKQLAQDCDSIPLALSDLYETHRDRSTSPSLDEIMRTISTMVDQYNELFVVVDALDECEEELRWNLVEQLRRLDPKLRLLITSRYLNSIEEELEGYARCEIKASKEDIELFIDNQIRKNRSLRKVVERSPSLRQDIKGAVVKTADDMYDLLQR